MKLLISSTLKVSCESRGRGRQERPLAVRSTDQRNLSLAMLRGGYAFLYGGGRQPANYRQAEQEAKDAKKGLRMFTGVNDPYDYRRSGKEQP